MNLNQHLRLAGDTRRIIWETVSYPAVVLLLALAVMAIFFRLFVPHYKQIYEDFDTELPQLTLLMIWISDHFEVFMLVLAVIVVRRVRKRRAGV